MDNLDILRKIKFIDDNIWLIENYDGITKRLRITHSNHESILKTFSYYRLSLIDKRIGNTILYLKRGYNYSNRYDTEDGKVFISLAPSSIERNLIFPITFIRDIHNIDMVEYLLSNNDSELFSSFKRLKTLDHLDTIIEYIKFCKKDFDGFDI